MLKLEGSDKHQILSRNINGERMKKEPKNTKEIMQRKMKNITGIRQYETVRFEKNMILASWSKTI